MHSVTEDTIAVTQQIAWGGIERKRVHDLLGRPLSSWVHRHIEVHNLSTVMTPDDLNIASCWRSPKFSRANRRCDKGT